MTEYHSGQKVVIVSYLRIGGNVGKPSSINFSNGIVKNVVASDKGTAVMVHEENDIENVHEFDDETGVLTKLNHTDFVGVEIAKNREEWEQKQQFMYIKEEIKEKIERPISRNTLLKVAAALDIETR